MDTIDSAIEHLEIPLVRMDGSFLPLLPLRHKIGLADPVEEQHDSAPVTFLHEDSCMPIS